MARKFQTVGDELLHVAEAAVAFMLARGFTVRAEHQDIAFPYCPTLFCKRGHATCVIEVVATIDPAKMEAWVAYGKSCGHDFRLIYVVTPELQAGSRNLLAEHGIGLLELENEVCVERVAAQDLSVQVQLPPLNSMPRAVMRLLGDAYEQFERGNWREGFESAAQSLEAEARRYLKRHATRVTYVGRPVTKSEVDRMSLGALANTFSRIQNQNLDDARIGATLRAINEDRIGVVHHRSRQRAERRLRANVGRHMWAICGAMKHVVN